MTGAQTKHLMVFLPTEQAAEKIEGDGLSA
jgi:hypothetical protein